MTIARYLPQWLRSRLQQPPSQKPRARSKKERQVLPTLPKPQPSPVRWQDDDSPPGYRVLWRM